MSSAFKNFIITFLICLLIFSILGTMAHKALMEGFDNFGKSSGQDDESSDATSEAVSQPEPENNDVDNGGDVFTAVVLCVDEDNKVVNCAFIDANERTGKYIRCEIPPETRISCEYGSSIPIAYLFGTMSPDTVCNYVSAMTGIETDYCFRFQKDDMGTIAGLMSAPSIKLSSPVRIPLFDEDEELEDDEADTEGDVSEEGEENEDDKYVVIENDDNGKVNLNKSTEGKSNLEWLLESEKDESGSSRNKMYHDISKALFDNFFVDQASTKKVSVLTKLMSISDNNFNSNAANQHIEAMFSNAKFDYHSPTYTNNRGAMVDELQRLDGRYNKTWFFETLE